ncbi:uncharacterized protein V6R79_011917 [Siganus canaliculatus]
MSVNSSSSSASLLPPPPPPPIFSRMLFLQNCLNSTVGHVNITAMTLTNILLLFPLFFLVFFVAGQRWRRRSGAAASHSDVLTYHMVVAELMIVFGMTMICGGVYAELPPATLAGVVLFFVGSSGQRNFHVLTCVERYLAVVHPVTYRNLGKEKGARVRNGAIGCVWLLGLPALALSHMNVAFDVTSFCLLGFTVIIVSFCSLSVLCVLIRPGPGEGGGARQRAERSKLRAFYTITVILGALLLKFGGSILSMALYSSALLEETRKCRILLTFGWTGLPGSLVLPLLFLHRAGKLRRCCRNASGRGSD